MPTSAQVQTSLLTAQLKAANLTLTNILALQAGALSANWKYIFKAQRGINIIQNKYNQGDLSSVTFKTAYSCLTSFIGNYTGGTIDPNAQNPGTVINITNPGATPVLVELNFPKGSPNPIVISSWQAIYSPILGNFPSIQVSTLIPDAISTFKTLVPGSGGINGTYYVNLAGGSGSGASALITIAGNVVTSVTLDKTGSAYAVNDVLTGTFGSISGFSITVASIGATYTPFTAGAVKVYDQATSSLLQYLYIDDPDIANPLLTGDAIRVLMKP
jgi:hypothetical protein